MHDFYSYFKRMLYAFTDRRFYCRYVKLPASTDSTPHPIRTNPKFYPFFKNAIGAMDGTQINCFPPTDDNGASRNRKGGVSQNCLACCSFELMFTFIMSGYEGSAADAYLFYQARVSSLPIPDGKYYIADAGFGACNSLIVPYRGHRYHLAEWGRANIR